MPSKVLLRRAWGWVVFGSVLSHAASAFVLPSHWSHLEVRALLLGQKLQNSSGYEIGMRSAWKERQHFRTRRDRAKMAALERLGILCRPWQGLVVELPNPGLDGHDYEKYALRELSNGFGPATVIENVKYGIEFVRQSKRGRAVSISRFHLGELDAMVIDPQSLTLQEVVESKTTRSEVGRNRALRKAIQQFSRFVGALTYLQFDAEAQLYFSKTLPMGNRQWMLTDASAIQFVVFWGGRDA